MTNEDRELQKLVDAWFSYKNNVILPRVRKNKHISDVLVPSEVRNHLNWVSEAEERFEEAIEYLCYENMLSINDETGGLEEIDVDDIPVNKDMFS